MPSSRTVIRIGPYGPALPVTAIRRAPEWRIAFVTASCRIRSNCKVGRGPRSTLGLDIQGGVLDVASVNALGSSFVTSTTSGGILAVGNTNDEVLANDLTGNLVLVKAGSGVLDVTGTNSYVLGTLINGGAKDRQRRLRPAAAGLEGSDAHPPWPRPRLTTPARSADRSILKRQALALRQEPTNTHS